MARTKSFDESEALESAMLLFWQKGYSATSMKELEQVMGLGPTSIYNAFGNKRALFQQALGCYLNTALAGFVDAMVNAKTARDALNAVLLEVIHLHFNKLHPGGCMVVLSLLESDQHDTKTKNILDSALRQLRNAIVQRIELGQKNGEVKPGIDCRIVGNQVTALITGMITMAKAGFSRKELKELAHSSTNLLLE